MRVTFLSWRDTGHPDGGGSELYVEELARRLVARGHEVTVLCARYPGAPARSCVDGVRFLRRGGRLSVYAHGLLHLLSPTGRRQDVVVEVINGLPFGARLVRRHGLVAVVHHLHRRQWQLIYPGPAGRLGWFVESQVTPRLYRGVPHVTVSEASRRDLLALGLPTASVRVVHNGLSSTGQHGGRSSTPRLVVLARLVPHKRIEHAFEVLAALREELPDLRLDVVGSGWWNEELVTAARDLGVTDLVTWHGHVADEERDRVLARAWVALLPSTTEGWGLSVVEAAAQGTPTIAYREAGGVTESVVDGRSGVLVDTLPAMIATTRGLLCDEDRLRALSQGARRLSGRFSWDTSAAELEEALVDALPQRSGGGRARGR